MNKRKSIFRLTFACMRCRDSDMGEAKRNRIHAVVRCKARPLTMQLETDNYPFVLFFSIAYAFDSTTN